MLIGNQALSFPQANYNSNNASKDFTPKSVPTGNSNTLPSFNSTTGLEASKTVNPADFNGTAEKSKNVIDEKNGNKECQTCKHRKYQDGSDDSGVSFQTPTKIAPSAVKDAVMSHEREHVTREQSKAKAEDRKVISQSVTIHHSICEECGKTYVSGGTTRTTTKGTGDERFNAGVRSEALEKGRSLDAQG